MVLIFGLKENITFKKDILPVFETKKYKKEGGSVDLTSTLSKRHRLTEENQHFLESIGYTVSK